MICPNMKLSVVIVNYNFCVLLRQSLQTIVRSCEGLSHEIIVVDNASTDQSLDMLAREFPRVQVIANPQNLGFAKANNQALKIARGEFILLIHPDTLTKKDTFQKVLGFMELHGFAGGVGVRMISPRGEFLPESKHGLTGAWATFFKLTGLYKYFPKSRLYNRFQKDWTDEFETAEVDVLNGAFMLLRKSVLDKVGLFDERFFMYGDDIDISYRIRLAGFKNYYFPKTYIIHFKGQNVRKFRWSFIKNYYGAMFIFAYKYLLKMPKISIPGMGQLFPLYEVER